jgi:hypothetical protein
MRKIINVIIIALSVLFVLSLTGCTDKSFEQTIDGKLNNITNPNDYSVSMSSNPNDYIKAVNSNEDYKYIVSQGENSLNYMLKKFANSDKNGLEEYIMATACSEILKENSAFKSWASGRQWYDNYTKTNK